MALGILRHISNEKGNFSVEAALIFPLIFVVVIVLFSIMCGLFFKYAATIQMNQAGHKYQAFSKGFELRLDGESKAVLFEIEEGKAVLENYAFHERSFLGVTQLSGQADYSTLNFAFTTVNGEPSFQSLAVGWEGSTLDYQIVLLNLEAYLNLKAMIKEGMAIDEVDND